MALFKRNKSEDKQETQDGAHLPASAMPANDMNKAANAWFERYGKPVVERNRNFAIMLMLVGVVILMAFTVKELIPLRKIVPYVLETDKTGATTPVQVSTGKFTPTRNQIKYFLAQWVTELTTVDPAVTTNNLIKAYKTTRGQGSADFRTYIAKYTPIEHIKKNAAYRATPQILSVNFLDSTTALVRYQLTVKNSNDYSGPKVSTWSMTVNYAIVPPKTEHDVYANPIGLFETGFSLAKEMY